MIFQTRNHRSIFRFEDHRVFDEFFFKHRKEIRMSRTNADFLIPVLEDIGVRFRCFARRHRRHHNLIAIVIRFRFPQHAAVYVEVYAVFDVRRLENRLNRYVLANGFFRVIPTNKRIGVRLVACFRRIFRIYDGVAVLIFRRRNHRIAIFEDYFVLLAHLSKLCRVFAVPRTNVGRIRPTDEFVTIRFIAFFCKRYVREGNFIAVMILRTRNHQAIGIFENHRIFNEFFFEHRKEVCVPRTNADFFIPAFERIDIRFIRFTRGRRRNHNLFTIMIGCRFQKFPTFIVEGYRIIHVFFTINRPIHLFAVTFRYFRIPTNEDELIHFVRLSGRRRRNRHFTKLINFLRKQRSIPIFKANFKAFLRTRNFQCAGDVFAVRKKDTICAARNRTADDF